MGLYWIRRKFIEEQNGKNEDGTWKYKEIVDEEESGFKHVPLSCEQVYFSNFYERSSEQDFIILRRIISTIEQKLNMVAWEFSTCYSGVVVMDDANRSFYQVYDPHMRQYDVE
jgi:hypothetical protein